MPTWFLTGHRRWKKELSTPPVVLNENLSNDRGERIDCLTQRAQIRAENTQFSPDSDKFLDHDRMVAERFGANHGDIGFQFADVRLTQSHLACDLFVDASDCIFEIVNPLRKISHVSSPSVFAKVAPKEPRGKWLKPSAGSI
jgi:hypothetical protein